MCVLHLEIKFNYLKLNHARQAPNKKLVLGIMFVGKIQYIVKLIALDHLVTFGSPKPCGIKII